MKLTVVCFYWHDDKAKCRRIYEYKPKHVFILKQMVEKHLTAPYDFVCVTDTPEEFNGEINTVLLDKTTFVPGTRYMKLMLWRHDIGNIIGERMLYLDLDCVITGSLDPIVDRQADVVLWRNPNFQGPSKRRARYNTSIMLITAGARPQLYEDFDPQKHPKRLRKIWGGTDQAWISHKLSWEDEDYWTDADGVYGAGRLARNKRRDKGVGTKLPDDARIVFFPGSRIPHMRKIKEEHPWIKKYLPT